MCRRQIYKIKITKNRFTSPEFIDKSAKFDIMDKKGTHLKYRVIQLLITREIDYALRVLRVLHREEKASASAISQREHMSKAITLKTLKRLHAGGLVSSCRGTNGGYFLTSSCDELSLWDVFHALEEDLFVNRCQQPGYRCENYPDRDCGLCKELSRVQAVLDMNLKMTPLSMIFQDNQEH